MIGNFGLVLQVAGCSINSEYFNWGPAVGLAVVVTFLIIALVYIASQFMRRMEWEVWAKTEMYQAAISVFLVVNILFFATLACNVSTEFTSAATGGRYADPFDVSYAFINDLLLREALPSWLELTTMARVLEYEAATVRGIGVFGGFGVSYRPFIGYDAIARNIDILTGIIGMFYTSLVTQRIGLSLIQATAFNLLLPIGIIMRTFPLTREAGSFLIATAVGFYVVFPLTYVMNYSLTEIIKPEIYQATWTEGVVKLYILGQLDFIGVYFMEQRFFALVDRTSILLPQAAFLPALGMIITTSFITSMTRFLNRVFD